MRLTEQFKRRLQKLAGVKPNLITEQLTPMDWLSGENVDTSVLNSIGLNVQETNINISLEACNGTPYYIGDASNLPAYPDPGNNIFLNFTINNMMQAPANTPLGCLYFVGQQQPLSITFIDVEPNAQNFNVTNINEIPAIINQFGNNNDWGGNFFINGFLRHDVVNAQVPGQALEITNTVIQQFLDDMGTEINQNQSCPYWNQYLNSGNAYYFNLCWYDYFSDEHQSPTGILGSIDFGINGFFTETEMPEDTDIDDLDPGLTDDEADLEGSTVDDIDNIIDPGTIDPPKDVDPVFPSGDDDIDDFDPGTIDPPKDTDPVRPFGDDDEEEDDDTDFPDDGGITIDDFDLEASPPNIGCMFPTATNYDPNAETPCSDCCVWSEFDCSMIDGWVYQNVDIVSQATGTIIDTNSFYGYFCNPKSNYFVEPPGVPTMINNPSFPGTLAEACACSPWGDYWENVIGGDNDPGGCNMSTFSCGYLAQWANCFINPNQLNVLFTGWNGSFNFDYWCQGCAGNVNGLSGGNWANYIQTSDPSFVGSYEEACACCPQGMPTSPIKERFQKLAGIKKIK